MPIYEFRCKKCEKRFELRRRLGDRDNAATCPECKSKRTVRSSVTAFAVLGGASADAGMGEGDSEDFMGGDGHGHDHGGFDMGDDFDF
ncbi:MAG: zinc ribbon domain-containing protein [Dehalococcoidia bacterium]